MKLALACVLAILAFPGVAADTAAPADPQLLRLEQVLSEKLAIKKEGRIAPEEYLAWETNFRENLGAAMSRAIPSPDNQAAHARITALLGERSEAYASLDRALENDPESPVLLRTKGQLQLEQGDFPGAAENTWAAYEKSGRTDMAALALHHTAKNRRAPSAVSAPPPSADSVPASVANDSNKPYRLAVKGKATPTEVPAVVRPESTNLEENRGSGLSLVTKLGIAVGILMLVWGGTPQETKDRLKHDLWEQPKQEMKTIAIVGAAAGAVYLGATYVPPLLATAGSAAPSGMMPALAGGGATGGGIAMQQATVGAGKAALLAGGGTVALGKAMEHVSYSKSDSTSGSDPSRSGHNDAQRSLDNPESLRGADADEVQQLIPKNWEQTPMRTGRGEIFKVPGTRGSDYMQISKGNPSAPDALHQGPYLKIVRYGRTIRIPLKGNSTLK